MTTDPLEALRQPPVPVDPGPAFRSALRARLVRALDPPPSPDPQGATMSDTTSTLAATGVQGLTTYLSVHDARAAIDWYVDVFGAEQVGDPYVMDDGRIGHAELRLAGTRLYLADEHPEIGFAGPRTRGGTTVGLVLQVPDSDAGVARAAAAGGTVLRAVEDQFYGERSGTVEDPFGHRWTLSTPVGGAAATTGGASTTDAGGHGDVGYFTLSTQDATRAQAFYGGLLGWTFTPGQVEQGFNIEGVHPMGGLHGGQAEGSVTLCYQVSDMAAAVARVRELGGTIEEPQRQDYGQLADCVDDQGMAFNLWQP